MPKIWAETIDTHRRAVRDAVLAATAALVADEGLLSVTMTRIAERAGIGRATLYKYFPDVEAVLRAWHDEQVAVHLRQLTDAVREADDAWTRVESALNTYAHISHERRAHHDADLAALLHRDENVAHAQRHVLQILRDVLTDGAKAGDIRDDVPPDELATYCMHALSAASSLPSWAAVQRLVMVTLGGLRRTNAS